MSLSWEGIFLLCMILAWAFGGVGAFLFQRNYAFASRLAHFAAFIGAGSGVAAALLIFTSGSRPEFRLWSVLPHLNMAFAFDRLSAFFLFVIAIVALTVTIYAPTYVDKYVGKKNPALLGAGFNLFLLSMVGVAAANNGFTFLVLWEIMSLVSFFLVIVEHEQEAVYKAGRLYVIMTHLGTGFIIFAFLTLFYHTGTLDFAAYQSAGAALPAGSRHLVFALALIGFGTKAGLVPLHIWLPRAHPVAPTHISALMSAVMIKTAVYGIIRVTYDFLGVSSAWWGAAVLAIGTITAVYGILFGVVEKDMKRFLAYSSIENAGLIFMGLGASFIFAALDMPVLAGFALLAALYHTLNHALFKGMLFMGAGAVYRATGTKNIERLGGLIRSMPQTAGLFLVGALAIASFPPFNGFISKWLTFQALLNLPFSSEGNVWLSLAGALAATALILVGALVALGFVKLFGVIFLAQPRSAQAAKAQEAPLPMRTALGITAAGVLGLGVFPGFIARQLSQVTAMYFPESAVDAGRLFSLPAVTGSSTAFAPAAAVLAIGVIIALALFLLYGWAGKSRRHTTETWACGIALKPTMSYTGTSFSHPLFLIFKPIFGAKQDARVKGRRIRFSLKWRHVFETYLYRPLMQGTVRLSAHIRKIQDGSIHSYLAYIFVTLIVLLLLVP